MSEIELWARDFDEPPVYWLNGLAGTGKTTIAQTIAERLFADGRLGASFFCSRNFEDRSNLKLIFPTLAVQLARRYTEFRSILVPLVQSDPEIAHSSLSLCNQMDNLIVQPLKKSAISTVIVIDALDECKDEEPASAILSVLGRFVSEIPTVKFFLTGRPEPRIREGFRLPLMAKATDVLILHEVKRSLVDNDIRSFLRCGFLEIASRRGGLADWPTKGQLDRLCERAEGLFIYAAAVVKSIGGTKRGPKTQLKTLLESQGVGDYEGEALDLFYASILQKAFGNDEPKHDTMTLSILGAIVVATNPISPSAIAMLLELDTEDVFTVLSSGSLPPYPSGRC